jgi:hypothetical protein
MAVPAPKNRWRYGLTALACMPPAALTYEKALALLDRAIVPIDKRTYNARLLADGGDITLWRRTESGRKAFTSVAVWRYDRRDQHDFRWQDDVLVLGLHVGVDDTPAEAAPREALVRFFLELGDIVQPDFMAVDLYDDFAERKGRDLTREVFAVNAYGPAMAAVLGARLTSSPALRVETRPWGATVVRVTDHASASSDPEARARVARALWPA